MPGKALEYVKSLSDPTVILDVRKLRKLQQSHCVAVVLIILMSVNTDRVAWKNKSHNTLF